MEFRVLKKSKKTRARFGVLKTSHGEVETPALVGVATQATIKTLTSAEVEATKTQLLICNTFHLHVRPGEKIIKTHGGLHKFMHWQRPLMTDSGGYQVFSLGFGQELKLGKMVMGKAPREAITAKHTPKSLRIVRDGVHFRSPLDGRELFLGPKESIRIQKQLGADIMFAFDECPPPTADRSYIEKSLERTHRWAKESLMTHNQRSTTQALFGIVQGGKYKDLRIVSARYISSLPFDGFGIGGELGFDKGVMFGMLKWVVDELPEGKPRHLLGNGHIDDLWEIFQSGVDTVDCIIPTHYARHGVAFISGAKNKKISFERSLPVQASRETSFEKLDFSKSTFLKDKKPLDPKCGCMVCGTYTRSYIAHLYRAKEITAMRLLTFHNLYFWNTVVENIRRAIQRGVV